MNIKDHCDGFIALHYSNSVRCWKLNYLVINWVNHSVGFKVEHSNMALYNVGASTMMNVTLIVSAFHPSPNYTSRFMVLPGKWPSRQIPLMGSSHSSGSFFPLFLRLFFSLPKSIKTLFTSHPSISIVITNPSSCEQVTCSISNLENEMTNLFSFPAMGVPEIWEACTSRALLVSSLKAKPPLMTSGVLNWAETV